MPIVLDASVVASWGLADETSTLADRALGMMETDSALVPGIWWYEIRNILLINERRQRLATSESATFLTLLSSYPIEIDDTREEEAVFSLARQFRLSIYDAAYLELARRQAAPLATLDKALQAAALAAGIPLLE
jgi:predicted nucleic acid-binding protein